jgi:hypothetical protein
MDKIIAIDIISNILNEAYRQRLDKNFKGSYLIGNLDEFNNWLFLLEAFSNQNETNIHTVNEFSSEVCRLLFNNPTFESNRIIDLKKQLSKLDTLARAQKHGKAIN